MEGNFDDFETYRRRIWSSKDTPRYAYFCWRWDEERWREGKRDPYTRVIDPKDDEDFKHEVLDSFVYKEEVYDILMEVSALGPLYHSPLTNLLWNTYGPTLARLLYMWRWAKSSEAFSMCSQLTGSRNRECARPACKVWDHNCEKYSVESPEFQVYSNNCNGGNFSVAIPAELDPSLVFFNEKLWSDAAARHRNKIPSMNTLEEPNFISLSSSDEFLDSLQDFFYIVYNELVPRTITDAIEVLQISKTPDVSFLRTNDEQADLRDRPLNNEQNSGQLKPILFAVAGSGKTQSIFNLLAETWGHYLVSGHISNSLGNQDSMLKPRRGGASADTQWLFELFERIKAKNDQKLSPRWYSVAVERLLANREALMEVWIKQKEEKPSGAQLCDQIYWLLFQTTCTPEYDPFIKTLRLRMIIDDMCESESEMHLPIRSTRTIIDEAQNELDPFWNEGLPLDDFIEAFYQRQRVFSVSGTSLRMKDCREVFRRAARYVTQPNDEERRLNTLANAIYRELNQQECSDLAKTLADRVLKACKTDFDEKRLIDFLQGKEFAAILGDFYFTKSLEKAKQSEDEDTPQLLEKAKELLVHCLGLHHQERFKYFITFCSEYNGLVPWSGNENQSIEDRLSYYFTTYHETMWLVKPSAPSKWLKKYIIRLRKFFTDHERVFLNLLRERFTFESLDQTSRTSFRLIRSDECFSTLLGDHIKRLLRKIGYFCSLGDKTLKYEFWRVVCPETMVFQSNEDDGRKDFFLRAKARLEQHVNANSATAHEWQGAADNVAEDFLQKEKAQMNDRICGITKYSALFRGRMRWSTVYIEHVFASYLNTSMDVRIEEKAKEAAESIKSNLKSRIKLLQSKGHSFLLKDLYTTAIRADLMHRPSIFPRDTSARMITEGFALLDPAESRHAGSTYAPKQKLSEPIVVDAVIEYLHEMECDNEDNLENVLRNLLFDNQDDASSFGKAAEYYFAWSLGGLFAQSSDGLDLSLKAREDFRHRIAQAKFIHTDNQSFGHLLGDIQGYDKYILEEPSPELESDLTLGSTLTFPEWLSRVRNEEFFPTFHFPSTYAGPDIIFCLKVPNTGERILCAFQIKTGEKCDKNDAFKLIRTLDPKLWFWTAPNLREALTKELEAWTSHRILTALVITSRRCIDFFASKPDFYNGMTQLQRHIQRWELCRELSHFKDYNDLKSMVDKLVKKESLPEKGISILESVKCLGKDLSQEIEDSAKNNSTTFARALIHEVEEGARKKIENAATSIYKPPGQREDKEAEQNETIMQDYDSGDRDNNPLPHKRRINGYYFVILDNTVLKTFLGSTFYHLCKAMKEVETAKEKNLARAEEAFEGLEFRCPVVDCKKNRDPYKYKGAFNKHMLNQHPEYEPEAKRRKLNPSGVENGSQAGNSDNEDVEMAEAEEFE